MEKDKKIGIAIAFLSVVALGVVFYFNVVEPLDYLSNSLYGEGLGNLCASENECGIFCYTNRGRCDEYCRLNPSNPLCGKLFGV